jgi:hypothetical protein
LDPSLRNVTIDKFIKCISFYTHDYLKLNNLIKNGIIQYAESDKNNEELLKKYLNENINLLMLDKNIKLKINDPYDVSFDRFIANVHTITCKVPCGCDNQFVEVIEENWTNNKIMDYANYQKLFIHNGVTYSGNRNTVYESIIMLNCFNEDDINNQDIVTLTSRASQSVINHYINTCHGNRLDMNHILPEDFIDFLNFIDKYPTDRLSVNLLENQIIYYIDKYNVPNISDIDSLVSRYQLKQLYLSIYQKKHF